MNELHEIIDEYSKSYTGKKWIDAWEKGNPAMLRRVMERAMTDYVKQFVEEEREILEHVKKMREAQKNYFSTRTQQALKDSKWWEANVDKEIDQIDNSKQLTMF